MTNETTNLQVEGKVEETAGVARKGKIARLPRWVREQVNERLSDGEPGGPLLEWLNGLDEVKEVMAKFFAGAPVNKQNLSEWRQGGFREWEPVQKEADVVRELMEHAQLLEDNAEGRDVGDWLAPVVSVELAKAAKTLVTQEGDPKVKWRRLRQLLSALAELRRVDHRAMRLRREQVEWDKEDEEADKKEWKEEIDKLKEQALAPFMAESQRRALSGIYGKSEFGQWAAEYISAVNHGLPLPEPPKRFDAGQSKSEQVAPSQSKSDQNEGEKK